MLRPGIEPDVDKPIRQQFATLLSSQPLARPLHHPPGSDSGKARSEAKFTDSYGPVATHLRSCITSRTSRVLSVHIAVAMQVVILQLFTSTFLAIRDESGFDDHRRPLQRSKAPCCGPSGGCRIERHIRPSMIVPAHCRAPQNQSPDASRRVRIELTNHLSQTDGISNPAFCSRTAKVSGRRSRSGRTIPDIEGD